MGLGKWIADKAAEAIERRLGDDPGESGLAQGDMAAGKPRNNDGDDESRKKK